MRISFTKMHGLGNDFVLLDERERALHLSTTQITALADRRYGVGCDQVLSLAAADGAADARYVVYNADGSPAEHCGNGVRCVAHYLARRGDVHDVVRVQIGDDIHELHFEGDDMVRVNMGVPDFRPARIPLAVAAEQDRYEYPVAGETLYFGAVSIGNPHAVFETASTDDAPVASIGTALQDSPLFPQRVNVGFMQVVDRSHLRLRVFERGVGETLACGTGACAAVAIGRRWDRVDDAVTVDLQGGQLHVSWTAARDDALWMTGPATHVFEGTIDL